MLERLAARYVPVDELGRGAMGVVVRAYDTRLARDVAIKSLPPQWARDARRMARFRREARILASLSHPNIAALHEIEEVDGELYLILEYVPGRSFGEVFAGPTLPLRDQLGLFRQLAEGIEAAHRSGILHRDLKPSNVALTTDGVVKILDFGLGKIMSSEAPDPVEPSTPSVEPTADGSVLGTHGYMSPEQVRGHEVDRRTDIWAFGCLLYESLARRRAFRGDTPADTIACVLERDPDWTALPRSLPHEVSELLVRSLQKDPRYRLRDIGEAWVLMDEFLEPGARGRAAVSWRVPSYRHRSRWRWIAGGVVLGAIPTLLATARRPPEEHPIVRPAFELHLTPPLANLYTDALSIAPDASSLVYTAAESTYIRPLNGLRFEALQLPPRARTTFFSPDGRWLGFFTTDSRLQKISLQDGQITTICNTTDGRGASWGEADSILFAPSFSSGLWMVSAYGGTPRSVTTLDSTRGEVTHRWPEILPGGKAAIFTSRRRDQLSYSDAEISLVVLATGERRTLVSGGFHARYAPPGFIVFARDSTLHAIAFDLQRLRIMGYPVPLDLEVATNGPTGMAQFAFTKDGTLAYVPGEGTSESYAVPIWLDRAGQTRPVLHIRARCENITASPNGERLAFTLVDAQNDIGVYDTRSGILTRLTFDPAEDSSPIWSRDGRMLAYVSSRSGMLNLFSRRADGSGQETRLTSSPYDQGTCDWTSDGIGIVFVEDHPETRADIWSLDLHDGERRPLVRTLADEREARVSPDGRWMAYQSNESGRPEIYVLAIRGESGRWQVTRGGGEAPRWSSRGNELFYVRPDRHLVAVSVRFDPTFHVETTTPLFRFPHQLAQYDIGPDGQSFVTLSGERAPDRLVVALTWSETIARRARNP